MEDCIFCKIASGKAAAYKVYEDKEVVAFLDIHPAVEGHTLVIPKAHYENIFDVPEDLLCRLSSAAKRIAVRYKEKGFDGINILSSSGREANQDVMHMHIHVIPRRSNDGHDVKILNYGHGEKNLKAVWERLKE